MCCMMKSPISSGEWQDEVVSFDDNPRLAAVDLFMDAACLSLLPILQQVYGRSHPALGALEGILSGGAPYLPVPPLPSRGLRPRTPSAG